MSEYSVVFGEKLLDEGLVSFIEVPEDFEIENLRLASSKVKDAIRGLEVGGYLLDEFKFQDLAYNPGTSSAIMYEVEDFEKGRQKNSHGLIFGQLVLRSQYDREKQAMVAIKPHDTPKDAMHEFNVTNYINGYGKPTRPILAFDTLGFHRFEDTGQYGLITRYDEAVISYDNIFWDPEFEPTQEQVRKALGKCGMALAMIHNFGLAHGDAQIKNFASDNHGIRFIDLESAKPFARTSTGAKDPDAILYQVKDDISTFVNSLHTGVEVDDSETGIFRSELLDTFSVLYAEHIKHPSSKLPKDARPKDADIKAIIEQSY